MIDFPCTGCGKVLSVKESLAGKTGRCPSCQASNTIPDPPPPRKKFSSIPADRPAPAPAVVAPKPYYEPSIQRVDLVAVNLPFGKMCWLIFRWTAATVPTMIALWLLYLVYIFAAVVFHWH